MAFRVKITVESEDAGWIPAAINSLLQRVAKDQKVPAVYETEGPDGAKARLVIDEIFEVEHTKSPNEETFFVN